MKKIDKVVDKDTPFDKDLANEHDLSNVREWALMPLVTFISGEDIYLHAKIRRDIAALTPEKTGSMGVVRKHVSGGSFDGSAASS